MAVWVDADACPNLTKQILFRAAERTGVVLTLVANQSLPVPRAGNIRMLQVEQGFDVADNEIVKRIEANDLLVTSDIPLAAEVIAKGAHVITPRGETLAKENIRGRLNMRDFLDTMRSSGVHSGGPAAISETEKRAFANGLDSYLARHFKANSSQTNKAE
jgi:uncharacterized protein YaiI (UPF0178 family)